MATLEEYLNTLRAGYGAEPISNIDPTASTGAINVPTVSAGPSAAVQGLLDKYGSGMSTPISSQPLFSPDIQPKIPTAPTGNPADYPKYTGSPLTEIPPAYVSPIESTPLLPEATILPINIDPNNPNNKPGLTQDGVPLPIFTQPTPTPVQPEPTPVQPEPDYSIAPKYYEPTFRDLLSRDQVLDLIGAYMTDEQKSSMGNYYTPSIRTEQSAIPYTFNRVKEENIGEYIPYNYSLQGSRINFPSTRAWYDDVIKYSRF